MASTTLHENPPPRRDLVMSYLAVRKAIGILGFFLPTVLLLYALITGDPLRPSISSYYYSPMREVFTGSLLAIAVFLWSYQGYSEPDRLITDKLVGRVAAVAVTLGALSPTDPPSVEVGAALTATPATAGGSVLDCMLKNGPTPGHPAVDYNLMQCLLGPNLSPKLHVTAAAVFFLALTIYCLVLFRRDDGGSAEKTLQERARDRIYVICGWTIIASIVLIGIVWVTELDIKLRPVFWLEMLGCFAFATSWTVKGKSMEPVVRMMARRL